MKTGLILEGGGMRGIFTAGVLDFFLEKNLEFSECLAVSAGACHACSFLAKQTGRAYAVGTDYLDNRRYCSLYSQLTTGELFGSKFLYHEIPEKLYPIDNETFQKSKTVFRPVVTNCETGQAEYPRLRDMFSDIGLVRASAALPLVAHPVMINGHPCLDGGSADSIPLQKAIDLGCKKNVVVLTQHRNYRKSPNRMIGLIALKYRKYPNLVETLRNRHNVYNETLERVSQAESDGTAFVIAPPEPLEHGRVEKNRAKLEAVYRLGYSEAKKQYGALCAYLEKKS